jgi:hypothetical protein
MGKYNGGVAYYGMTFLPRLMKIRSDISRYRLNEDTESIL